MDLTKVTLPTFILEKRSLLEMYADFFAHPDLFVSIVDRRDAKERMVEVVRWYLSAFHAGRKGSLAKKPYNPILGEIFRCYWRIGDKPGCPPSTRSTWAKGSAAAPTSGPSPSSWACPLACTTWARAPSSSCVTTRSTR
ncbi:hypothetical protein V5799_018921 [Amblyomma americanum]|uniref:Uncharacterized protein n=1 Tax=Amblyomma americanum TaxID=6943 RepID=A0AAQ4EY05_AMBAM